MDALTDMGEESRRAPGEAPGLSDERCRSLLSELDGLKRANDAVVLAHYYTRPEVQRAADYVGDSFALARLATTVPQRTLVIAGVSFMAESMKLLNPDKRVLVPDPSADCPMAHMVSRATVLEARERYGDDAVDESNRKMLKMSKQEYADFRALEEQIRSELERAVGAGDDPAGETGERICSMHRTWLGYTWPAYSAEAHRGLAESYVADDRFRSYYDRSVEGCATWLRDAIVAHAR